VFGDAFYVIGKAASKFTTITYKKWLEIACGKNDKPNYKYIKIVLCWRSSVAELVFKVNVFAYIVYNLHIKVH
jgi:hypothetical protein